MVLNNKNKKLGYKLGLKLKESFSLPLWYVVIFDLLAVAIFLGAIFLFGSLIASLNPMLNQLSQISTSFEQLMKAQNFEQTARSLQFRLIIYTIIPALIALVGLVFGKALAYAYAAGKKFRDLKPVYYLKFLAASAIFFVMYGFTIWLIQYPFFKTIYYNLTFSVFAKLVFFLLIIFFVFLTFYSFTLFFLSFTVKKEIWKGFLFFFKNFIDIKHYWRPLLGTAIVFLGMNIALYILAFIPFLMTLVGLVITVWFIAWLKTYFFSFMPKATTNQRKSSRNHHTKTHKNAKHFKGKKRVRIVK